MTYHIITTGGLIDIRTGPYNNLTEAKQALNKIRESNNHRTLNPRKSTIVVDEQTEGFEIEELIYGGTNNAN